MTPAKPQAQQRLPGKGSSRLSKSCYPVEDIATESTENTEMIINYNGIPVFAVFNFSVGLSVVCYSAEPPNLCTKPTPTASALPVD